MKVDGIEVSVESSASKTVAELDRVIAKLNQVSDGIRAISDSNGNKSFIPSSNLTGGGAKGYSKEIEKVQRSTFGLQKIISGFSDVGKGARFEGTYSQLEKEISKVTLNLDKLAEREEKMKLLGRDSSSPTMWKDLQYDISKTLNTLIAYQEQLSSMGSSRNAAFAWQGVPYDNFEDFWEAKNRFVSASEEVEDSIESVQKKLYKSTEGKTLFSANAIENSKIFEKNIRKAIIPTAKLEEKVRALLASLDKPLVGKGLKTYSNEYKALQTEIDNSKAKVESLKALIDKGYATSRGFSHSSSLRKYQYEIEKTKAKIFELENAQDRLQMSGKATKWNLTDKYESLLKTLARLRGGLVNTESVIIKASKAFANFIKRILSIILPSNMAKKSIDRLSASSGGVAKNMGMLFRMLKMMVVFRAFSATIEGIRTGMENLSQYSSGTNTSLSMLMNSINQLKNAFASATAPILNMFAPAINSVMQLCISASNAVNQLFAALTGQGTWIKTIALAEDYASKITDVTKAAEKLKNTTMSYDELHVSNDNSNDKNNGTTPGDMFETVPLESKYKEIADKISNFAKQLFSPIKQAWDEVGKFVMDSWEYALENIWELIQSIGIDFIKVWQQGATVEILENMLTIVGDIGLVVGNLAGNFEKAWSNSSVGLRILENIRDIIGIIVFNIKNAADATVNWSKYLDFYPLLSSFERFTSSLKPAIESLSGILTDFYEKVLLPLGKWTIEKGLPQLLDVFTAFNEKIDWDGLRDRFAQFWEHLEPFAETVGEGLIIFIERASGLLANFMNSDSFEGFLSGVEKWMDSVEPDDVADAIENLIKALLAFKGVVVALDAILKASAIVTAISNIGKFLGVLSGGGVASGLSAIGGAIAGWAPHIAVGAAIVGVVKNIKEEVSDRRDTSEWNLFDWISETLSMSASGWKSELDNFAISLELWWQDTWLSDKIWNFGQWWNEHVTPYFEETDWTNLFSVIKSALGVVWGLVVEWWDNSALGAWWNEHVSPYFEETDWTNLFSVIKSALQAAWGLVVEWWEASALGKWWAENVAPYFEDADWKDLFSVIESTLRAAWGLLVQWWESSALYKWYEKNVKPWFTNDKWNFEGIKKGLGMAFDAAVDAVKQIWNKFANWLNSKLKLTIPPIKVLGFTLFGGTTLDLGKIPTFQTGGFPEDGLFAANHNELIGKFSNGKPVVINNNQIVDSVSQGVKGAVTEAMMDVFMATNGNTENQNSDRPLQLILNSRIIAESTYKELEDMAMRGEIPALA